MNTDSKNINGLSVLVKINGEDKLIPQGTTILKLLEIYKINKDRVVIELNKEILKKDQYNTYIKKTDVIELVTFVGGG